MIEILTSDHPLGIKVSANWIYVYFGKKTTVDNAIAVLKQKGYIKRSGSNKTGFWEILNAEEIEKWRRFFL